MSKLRLNGTTSGFTELSAPDTAGNNTFKLPSADGTSGQVLSTDGAGNLSWATAGGGSSITEGNTSAEVIDTGSDGRFVITTEGVEALRVDSSQRVGVGTTVPTQAISIGGVSSTPSDYKGLAFQSGSTEVGYVRSVVQDGSNYALSFGNYNNSLSEKARIDSSGRLLVGTSSSSSEGTAVLQGNSNSSLGGPVLWMQRGQDAASTASGDVLGRIRFANNASNIYAAIEAFADAAGGSNDYPGRLVFSTTADGASSPTERMRIDSSGRLLVGTTAGAQRMRAEFDAADQFVFHAGHNHATNPLGIEIRYSASSPNSTTKEFLYCSDSTTVRAAIRSNGGLANYSANNANLSDRNAKKDISPAADTWDCIKEWEIVNYRYKDQPDDADLNLGVIAQQVAESCPEVITVFQEAKEATETEPAQEERLGVKEQQMYWMAIKALQEAQARIETLEAKVAALESA